METSLFHSFPLFVLILLFLAAAIAVWIAGVYLSNTSDTLSGRFGLGQALGGLILLSIATNLPEIAITVSASLSHNLGLAVGNILGGIAVQTVVLVLLDIFGLWKQDALSYAAASLELVLEGVLVVAILILAIMGTQLPKSLVFWRIAPGGLLITILWIVGIWLLGKARKGLPWQEKGRAPDTLHKNRGEKTKDTTQKWSTPHVVIVFLLSSLITLIAGVVLEESGSGIASHIGLSGVLFGSTVLAASTSLPELSTGLASVKAKAYNLAFSDIFGGNAFLPVLFLLATLLSGQAVLPQAKNTDIYLAGLGILLTTVYLYGLIFRPKRQILRMGIDSLVVLVLYIIGTVGLFAIALLS
ncbi:MAG TPA: sodium:proton exchanger [Ktedonobacter sp.]|nr:sodium:proton exchanger [Ktedonobacter sp.]